MNKDIQTKEYLKKLKDLKLSSSSYSRIENNLLEYAHFHSVRVGEDSRSIEQVPQRTSIITKIFNLNSKSMTAAIIAVMLVVGGGTSFAAEGSVPGDFLYPVKTELNENVKSMVAISSASEARLQVSLIEERLKEATELASRGELSSEVSTSLSNKIKSHNDRLVEQNSKLETKGDYQSSATVRATLEGSLRTHVSVLSDLNANISGNEGSVLISSINSYAKATAKSQVQATATIDTSVDIKMVSENMFREANTLIAQVETKLDKSKSLVSAEAYARIEAKLTEAVSIQATAKNNFESETYTEAYAKSQLAFKTATEAETLLNSLLQLKLDITTNGVVDSILNIETKKMDGTKTDSKINTDKSTTTDSEENEDRKTENNSSAGIDLDANVNAEVDTDVLEVNTSSDVSSGIKTNLNSGL